MRISKRVILIGTVTGAIVIGIVGIALGGEGGTQVPLPEASTAVPLFEQTPSPAPTEIPTPEPQTEPCPNEAEQAYFAAASESLVPLGTALTEASQLLIKAGENPALLLNDEWKVAVAVQFATINVSSDRLFALEAPSERTEEIQSNVRAGALSATLAVEAISKGIDDLDADMITEGITYMEAGSIAFNEVTRLTLAMCEA